MAINIEEVKKYNAALREQQDRSAKLRAELEFNQKELDKQCRELSAELGIEITPSNIKDVLAEYTEKINNTMNVGNEILSRIQAEEQQVAQANAFSAPHSDAGNADILMPPKTPAPSAPNFGDFSGDLPPIFSTGNSGLKI